MSNIAKFNEELAVELGLPTNMDKEIREITTPLKAGPRLIGWVPEIHEKGEEHPFQITEYEAELLARHWAEELRYIYDWRIPGYYFSEDVRMEPYAHYRIGRIQDLLGRERVQQLFETVMGERRCWRVQFEPRVATDHGLHAAILLESFIQDAEREAGGEKKRCNLTDVCLSEPRKPTDPGYERHYPYLTRTEFDAGFQKLVEDGLIRESKDESAPEWPDGKPRRGFYLTPLALQEESQEDSGKTPERSQGETTATDESGSEGVQ